MEFEYFSELDSFDIKPVPPRYVDYNYHYNIYFDHLKDYYYGDYLSGYWILFSNIPYLQTGYYVCIRLMMLLVGEFEIY